jgi:hypothetical protein
MGIQYKKLFQWLALPVFLIALIIAATFLAPVYLNEPPVKKNIEAAISRELGGEVHFRRLVIVPFPRPGVSLQQSTIAIPKMLSGTIESIRVYPQIVPLFRGKMLIAKIQVRTPDLLIALPETVEAVKPLTLSLSEVHDDIRLVLNYLVSIGPGLVVELDDGTFVLRRKGRLFLSLRNSSARFNAPPGEMGIELKATTDHWGDFGLSGFFSFTRDKAEAKDLSLRLGRSAVTGLYAGLVWGKRPSIEVLAGSARLLFDELFPWLSSSGSDIPLLHEVTSLKGSVVVDSMQGGGPIAKPASWQRRITGQLQNVTLESNRLPASLSVNGGFNLEDRKLAVTGLSARLGRSSFSRATARLTWEKSLYLKVFSGNAAIALNDVYQWSSRSDELSEIRENVDSLEGTVKLSAIRLSGPLWEPRTWRIDATGSLEKVLLNTALLPGPVFLSRGTFSLVRKKLSFSDVHTAVRDSTFTLSGFLQGFPADIHSTDLVMSGRAGPEIMGWLFTKFNVPPELLVNAPLTVEHARLAWEKTAALSFDGKIVVENGPALDIEFQRTPAEFTLKHVSVTDRDTHATLTLHRSEQTVELSFSGTLALPTLNRIFKRIMFGTGKVQGDLRAAIRTDHPLDSLARGNLEADHVVIPWGFGIPFTIDRASLRADGHIATLTSAAVTWGNTHYDLSGTASSAEKGLVLDGDVVADRIIVEELTASLTRPAETPGQQRTHETPAAGRIAAYGLLRVKSRELHYGKYRIDAPQARVAFGPNHLNITFTSAHSCGISIPGTIVVDHGTTTIDFPATAAGGQLEQAMSCLTGEDVKMSGMFSLNAELRSQSKAGGFTRLLEGKLQFNAKDGKIYRYPLLAKIFSVLSVTEIFRGRIPELGGSGFPYRSLSIDARIKEGKLKLDHAFIDGSSLDIIAEGEVDLVKKDLDLVVLVAPFSTVNWVIRHIPLVGKVLGGTLISIPVKVTGDWSNPDVVFLAPSAVGTRIVEILEDIIHLPVDIISPLLPKQDDPESRSVR